MRDPRHRRHGLAWLSLTVFQFVMIDAYALWAQREGHEKHYVPDPKSARFPAHALIFSNSPGGRWACNYLAAFNNMMAERKNERTKYWCSLEKVRGERQ